MYRLFCLIGLICVCCSFFLAGCQQKPNYNKDNKQQQQQGGEKMRDKDMDQECDSCRGC